MRKIVGFKIQLRPKEAERRAKKAKLDLAAAGLGETELAPRLAEAAKALKPAVLFDTFTQPDGETPLSPMPGLACSVVLATIGGGLPAEGPLAPLRPILEEMALEEAVRFAVSLLETEAAQESCELSPITRLVEPAALELACRRLGAAKIGVSADGGTLTPPATSVCSLAWLSKSKAKGKSK